MLNDEQQLKVIIIKSIILNLKVLLLNEVINALDFHAERVVQDAFHHMSINKTILIIIHKFIMIMTIDNIAVIMSEKIIKQEIYSELLKHDDLYIAIMHAQDLDVKIEASKFHEKLKEKNDVKKAFNQSFILQ